MKRMNVFEEMLMDLTDDLTREYNRLSATMTDRPETAIFRVAMQNIQTSIEYQPKSAYDMSFVSTAGNDGNIQMYLN